VGNRKELHTRTARARAASLISDEHFTVDGTLLEAWASLKSFQPPKMESRTRRRTIPVTQR
jgi:hypothetical protein